MSITQIIEDYIEKMRDLICEKYTARDSVSNWLGMGKVQKSPSHEQLYKDVAKEVELTVQKLDAAPDEQAAKEAAYAVLTCGRDEFTGMEDSIRLSLISIEALAIPLLDYMNPEDVARLCDEYTARCPVKDMMPRQKELYRRMCDLLGRENSSRKPGLFHNGRRGNR
ncbi:MAG: hypothetical protein LUC83_04280 [Clostridiales bacterium]|nr:hypothetical protein [Clostridiales bacterium]